jgi:hypothetical protein
MKILASDFDKTLFTSDYKKNILKINEFVDKGNIFIIATGRNITHLKEDINGHNIKYEYLICNDGAIIFDKDHNVVYRKDIDPEIVKPIFDILSKDKNIMFATIDDSVNYVNNTEMPANAILGRPFDIDEAENVLSEILNKYPSVNGYTSDNWVNITDSMTSKGNAVKIIQEMLNIEKEDVYTVGDNINDISMNEIYNGYAMEDGHPELIRISKGTTTSVSNLIDLIYENDNN